MDKDVPITIIWDSVAASSPKAELLGDYDKESIGLQARAISKGMRKITGVIGQTNSLFVILNQIRTKIGVIMSKKTFSKIVSESAKELSAINSDQLNELIKEDDNFVILDVSDKQTVEDRGFVPGAVNISLGTLYYKADSEVPDDYKDERIQDRNKKVVMTCSIGACAAIGGKLLTDMGFKDVVLLEGGVEAWKKSGYDIEK